MNIPAFPLPKRNRVTVQTEFGPQTIDEGSPAQEGMTLRDYFAAKAMQAYINAHPGGSPDHRDAPDWVPSVAYEMADAMLSERDAS